MGRWSCDIIIWWITKKNGALALMLLLATLLQVLGTVRAIGCFECEAKSTKGWDDANAQCNSQGVVDCTETKGGGVCTLEAVTLPGEFVVRKKCAPKCTARASSAQHVVRCCSEDVCNEHVQTVFKQEDVDGSHATTEQTTVVTSSPAGSGSGRHNNSIPAPRAPFSSNNNNWPPSNFRFPQFWPPAASIHQQQQQPQLQQQTSRTPADKTKMPVKQLPIGGSTTASSVETKDNELNRSEVKQQQQPRAATKNNNNVNTASHQPQPASANAKSRASNNQTVVAAGKSTMLTRRTKTSAAQALLCIHSRLYLMVIICIVYHWLSC